jgi:hypothetical protein
MFKLSSSADTIGTTIMGEVEVPPFLVVQRFGQPSTRDGDKVSGEFVFVDHADEPFIVHDWKSTSQWDERFPTPEEFWTSEEMEELCISTRDSDVAVFRQWFLEQIRKGRAEHISWPQCQ